jgi:hypothetical protein
VKYFELSLSVQSFFFICIRRYLLITGKIKIGRDMQDIGIILYILKGIVYNQEVGPTGP